MIKSIFLFAVMSAPSLLMAQGANSPSKKTSFVTCGDNPPFASKTVRSQVFVAPGGKHRVFAEVEAIAPRNDSCSNYSKLYLQPEGGKYSVIFVKVPTPLQRGNGIKIVGWSPDGTLLLFKVPVWQVGSDAVMQDEIWVYDMPSALFFPVELEGLAKQFDEGCFVNVDALGFADSKVLLKVTARRYHDEEGLSGGHCTEHDETWSYNLGNYEFKLMSPTKARAKANRLPTTP